MSYITLDSDIPPFSKAVISFWFRIPRETMEAAANEVIEPAFTFVLPNTIPLFTFGTPQTKKRYEPEYTNVGVPAGGWPGPTLRLDSPSYSVAAEDPVNPSFIGVACQTGSSRSEDGGSAKGFLHFNLQTQNRAAIAGRWANREIVQVYSSFYEPFPPSGYSDEPGSGWTSGEPGADFTTLVDNSYIFNAQPEYFRVETIHEIAPDTWHHLMLSFDISGDCSAGHPHPSTSCKLWYAIDDVDYRGQENMQPFRDADDEINPNGIVTENCYYSSGGDGTPGNPYNCSFGPPTCTASTMSIPSNDAPFGIPASAEYVDHIRKVQMAEFLLFPNVTLDTAEEGNRRLFITKPDKQGFQRPTNFSPITIPFHKFAFGDPVIWEPGADWPAFAPGLQDPSAIPTTLMITGGPPATTAAVDFTKCSFNWMIGRNTGTSKGKVERIGKVKSYWPPEFESPRIQSAAGGDS